MDVAEMFRECEVNKDCGFHIQAENVSGKKAYLDASKEDIILIDSPVGLPGRAVRNKFSDTIMSGGRIAPVRCRGCLKNCRPDKIPYCITDALITSVTGDAKNGLVFCGADAWRCDHLEYAEDVIESLLS